MLLRQDSKMEGNKWGAPAGKVEKGEDLVFALKREVFEETNIGLENPRHKYKLFVRFPYMDFIYHIFHEEIKERPKILLKTDENKEFRWVKPLDALKMNLVLKEDDCIKLFYNIK
jgi:8-oxo-dGTP pyrophosphatase MutT (NUDIX family)